MRKKKAAPPRVHSQTANRWRRIVLGEEDLHALVRTGDYRQQDAVIGDALMAVTQVALPMSEAGGLKVLDPRLQFGIRICPHLQSYDSKFPNTTIAGRLYRLYGFPGVGESWHGAVTHAELLAARFLVELIALLNARHLAYHSEGFDYLVTARLQGEDEPPPAPLDFAAWVKTLPPIFSEEGGPDTLTEQETDPK